MASLIPAGLSVIGGLLSSSSKGKEAQQIQESAAEANRRLEPFVAGGAGAEGTITNALSGGSQAFEQFKQSSGFQSQLREGSRAITGNAAARGLLNSGATLKRLNKFGQDLSEQGFSNFIGQLQTQASRGATAAAGVAGREGAAGVAAAGARSEGAAGFQSGIGQAGKILQPVVTNALGSLFGG